MFTLMWPHLLKSLSWSLYSNHGPCPSPWEWSPGAWHPSPSPGPWWKVLVNITAETCLRWCWCCQAVFAGVLAWSARRGAQSEVRHWWMCVCPCVRIHWRKQDLRRRFTHGPACTSDVDLRIWTVWWFRDVLLTQQGDNISIKYWLQCRTFKTDTFVPNRGLSMMEFGLLWT